MPIQDYVLELLEDIVDDTQFDSGHILDQYEEMGFRHTKTVSNGLYSMTVFDEYIRNEILRLVNCPTLYSAIIEEIDFHELADAMEDNWIKFLENNMEEESDEEDEEEEADAESPEAKRIKVA